MYVLRGWESSFLGFEVHHSIQLSYGRSVFTNILT